MIKIGQLKNKRYLNGGNIKINHKFNQKNHYELMLTVLYNRTHQGKNLLEKKCEIILKKLIFLI